VKLSKKGSSHKKYYLVGVALLVILGAYLFYIFTRPCFAIPVQVNVDGTQGYRLWQGEDFKSFEHRGLKMCIPEGWRAIGASIVGAGWARFPSGYTGVAIKSDAFDSTSVTPRGTSYTLEVVYPKITSKEELKQYESIINRSFTSVGTLFVDPNPHTHTVLITSKLAGNTVDDGTRVYPDPSEYMSIIVRTPEQSRGEQLFLHAVMHLYNRHRSDLGLYQKNQNPFSDTDFQEAEATWAETALLPSNEGRKLRIEYMYRIHSLLKAGKFADIRNSPFNDLEENSRIVQSAIVARDASTLDEQYGHYILMPLTMLAIEGLLQKDNAKASIEKILTRIHNDKSPFLEALAEILPGADIVRIESWIHGDVAIPKELVDFGRKYYDSSDNQNTRN